MARNSRVFFFSAVLSHETSLPYIVHVLNFPLAILCINRFQQSPTRAFEISLHPKKSVECGLLCRAMALESRYTLVEK
jgi:hypothetical protein